MSERKYCFLSQKNIIFIGVMRRIRQREIVFLFFLVLLKQPIENKHYFYKSFSLTQDSFPSTKFFFMLPNTEKCGKLSLQKVFQQNKQSVKFYYQSFFKKIKNVTPIEILSPRVSRNLKEVLYFLILFEYFSIYLFNNKIGLYTLCIHYLTQCKYYNVFLRKCKVTNCSPNPKGIGNGLNKSNTINL